MRSRRDALDDHEASGGMGRHDHTADLGGAVWIDQNELTAPEGWQHRVPDNAHAATSSKGPSHQLRGGGYEGQRLQLAVYQGMSRPLVAQNML